MGTPTPILLVTLPLFSSKYKQIAAPWLLSACSVFNANVSRKDIADRYSSTRPTGSLTSFTPDLVSMELMFKANNISSNLITSSGLPDYSQSRGSAGYGTKEMLISAISTMSKESGALRYMAYDRTTPNIIYCPAVGAS